MKSVNENEFYKILETEKNFLANFSANWCRECIKNDKILEDYSKENPNVKIYRIDVEENTDIANKFGVINVPAVLVFENKNIKTELKGTLSPDEISQVL